MTPLLLLVGCSAWNLPDGGYFELGASAWDPAVVAATDGVYIALPAAGALVRVTPDGQWDPVDLDGARVDRMQLAPDGHTLLTWTSWPVCADDDPHIQLVSDCDPDDLSTSHEFLLVRDGVVDSAPLDVPYQYNAVGFNSAGNLAATWLDFETAGDLDIDGVLNLTEAVFIPLDGAEAFPVPVGFAPENVLFTDSSPPRAVVLSRSQVAVVDLEARQVVVTYPLTLDPDNEVEPTDVVLTPDGGFALVSVSGSSDLYVLNLVQESIDIVDLDAVPTDLLVDAASDRTVIVYGNTRSVDVLEHEYFETESFALDEPATAMLPVDGKALLFNQGSGYRDVYLFDIASGNLTEYRAENPVLEMFATADHQRAVATMDIEATGGDGVGGFYDSHYGLGIFDLTRARTPISLLLEGRAVGVALVEDAGANHALVLSEGVDQLLQINLDTATNQSIALSEPPLGITAQPGGAFVITEESALGLVGFLTPGEDQVVEVAGFAASGLFHENTLPRRGGTE